LSSPAIDCVFSKVVSMLRNMFWLSERSLRTPFLYLFSYRPPLKTALALYQSPSVTLQPPSVLFQLRSVDRPTVFSCVSTTVVALVPPRSM
jgi:hypothetical protein